MATAPPQPSHCLLYDGGRKVAPQLLSGARRAKLWTSSAADAVVASWQSRQAISGVQRP